MGLENNKQKIIEKVMKKLIMILATAFAAAMSLMVDAEVISSVYKGNHICYIQCSGDEIMTICNRLMVGKKN